MNPTKKIRELFAQSNVTVGAEVDDRIIGHALTALDESVDTRTAPVEPDIWRMIMKSPITKIAAAAVITVACFTGLHFWRSTGSGIVLADVLSRIENVKAVRYKSTFTMTGLDPDPKNHSSDLTFYYTHLASGTYGWKEIGETFPSNGGKGSVFQERYFLPQKKTFILINLPQKKYLRRELGDAQIKEIQKENIASNPFTLLKEVLNTRYESVGRSTIDGIEAEGFRTTDPNLSVGIVKNAQNLQVDNKIWVDVKTQLPVRYDCVTRFEDVGEKEKRNLIYRSMMHDFQWDVPVDASEFEPPAIPDGYEVVDRWGMFDEQVAIDGLKQCIELFGSYITISESEGPALIVLSALEKSQTSVALQLKEDMKGLTESEKLNEVRGAGRSVIQLIRLYRQLMRGEKDPAYYGKTVTPQDTDKVLLRWQRGDGQYRVIFGDLRVKTITAKELADLEKP